MAHPAWLRAQAHELLTSSARFAWRRRLHLSAVALGLTIPFVAAHYLDYGAEASISPKPINAPVRPRHVVNTLNDLVLRCGPTVSPDALLAIMHTESAFN